MKIVRLPRIATIFAAVACATIALAAPHAGKGKLRHASRPVKGEYIVVLKKPAAGESSTTVANALSLKHGGAVTHVFSHALDGFAIRLTEQQAQALSEEPGVDYVEEDAVVTADSVQSSAPWGLDRIDQRDLPLNGTYDNHTLTGAGVTVYVIDSGIRTTHQEFGGRAWVGADFVGDGLNGTDGFGHGTHVAGTIGGSTYGVAKGVSLCAVRVLDAAGHGDSAKLISGVDWVTSHHVGASVANVSLTSAASDSIDQAVRNSIASGVVYVVSAGNDNIDASQKSPARVAEALTVGAIDSSDTRAYFSNYGSVVDVFAPGVGITSAWCTSDSATNTIDGTSMAAPHVAGLAALRLQRFPDSSAGSVHDAIKGNATRDKVINEGTGSTRSVAYMEYMPPAGVPIYKIVNVGSGLVLDVISDKTDSGTEIDQWDYMSAASQQWTLDSIGSGVYKITNVNSGKVLDVEGDSTASGTHIDQWEYVNYTSQQWTLTPVGNGAYKITNVNSGKVLDVMGDSVTRGALIDQWDYVGFTSQQFYLVQVN